MLPAAEMRAWLDLQAADEAVREVQLILAKDPYFYSKCTATPGQAVVKYAMSEAGQEAVRRHGYHVQVVGNETIVRW